MTTTKSKHHGMRRCRDLGAEAAKEGKAENDCPYMVAQETGYFGRARRRYWLEGHRAAAAGKAGS